MQRVILIQIANLLYIFRTFTTFRTREYKAHYYSLPTNIRFVMLTSPELESMRIVLHQIYVSLYVEYVVKNPIFRGLDFEGEEERLPPDDQGRYVDVEFFDLALDRFLQSLSSA